VRMVNDMVNADV